MVYESLVLSESFVLEMQIWETLAWRKHEFVNIKLYTASIPLTQ